MEYEKGSFNWAIEQKKINNDLKLVRQNNEDYYLVITDEANIFREKQADELTRIQVCLTFYDILATDWEVFENKKSNIPDKLGLFRLYWKDGGTSLASVGVNELGDKWFAPINWINVPSFDWDKIEKFTRLFYDGDVIEESKKKTLSDKTTSWRPTNGSEIKYFHSDVKDFIKTIKKEISDLDCISEFKFCRIETIINDAAGKKLI